MVTAPLLILLTALTTAPVCGPGALEPLRRELLFELNLARTLAGRTPLAADPTLCAVAAWRAARVLDENSGRSGETVAVLQEATRRIWRGGYRPHAWSEATLIGDLTASPLEQLRQVRPEWTAETIDGDFQHAGVGTARAGGRPVITLLVGLPKCAFEERLVAPLASLESVRRRILARVNRVRADRGRPPLARDPRLDRAAQGHARAMAETGFYDHRAPDGRGPAARVKASGYPKPRAVAENIAKGLFEPEEVVDRWMDSSGHRRNLLRPGARKIGLGVAYAPSTDRRGDCYDVLWVQLFVDR